VGGYRLRLPWWALQRIAPGLAITHPLRLAVPALVVVAALAAVGASRLLNGRIAFLMVPLVLVDGLMFSGAPWPVPLAPAAPPLALTQLEGSGGVLDLPPEAGPTMTTSRYLWWQTAHGKPIPYAPDVRALTSSLFEDVAFRKLAVFATVRADHEGRTKLPWPGPGEGRPMSLLYKGMRWIVVHPEIDPDAAAATEASLRSTLGPPKNVDGTLVWDLGEPH
jgi:hypothetical protein